MAEILDRASPPLVLKSFVPFRLNRLAEAVSADLSEIYRHRFKLEIAEWRVLVTVGQRSCTAQRIASSTRMHKTRVSRAVASLESRELLERETGSADARERSLRLSKAGQRIYASLIPEALQREREILACFNAREHQQFLSALTRLEESLGLVDG